MKKMAVVSRRSSSPASLGTRHSTSKPRGTSAPSRRLVRLKTMSEEALAAAGVDSYREFEARQQPTWPDQDALLDAVKRLEKVPPLVFAGEADVLREELAAAG